MQEGTKTMGKVKESLLEDMMFNPHLYNNPMDESILINVNDSSIKIKKEKHGKTIHKETIGKKRKK